MSIPTIAKELAIYFYQKKGQKINSRNMSKAVVQLKQLLNKGYTEKQIKKTIDIYIDDMYSVGYLNYVIDGVITKDYIDELKAKDLSTIRSGAIGDNKAKAERFDTQSRFRKKYNFDLFEKPE